MRKKPIIFIAFKGADNHGIGYMRAVLASEGFKTRVLDIRRGKKAILSDLKKSDPMLIGFSIIFQSHIRQFTDLISFLKNEGVKCHFTAGGHYATLKYGELFSLVPRLDSVVRFEGEYTILELARCVNLGSDWKSIFGLAYMNDKKIVTNPLRHVEKDLDRFPVKIRPKLRQMAFNMKFATIIAGRGCIHNCSFCNTREYYLQMSGPARRNRSPEKVVNEMAELFNGRQCAIFRFDDDDFPVTSRNSNWILQFCRSLKDKGLNNKIIWTINCRPDEIDEKNFKLMKENGLFHVFIGIEDGTEEGLKRLNKNTRVDQNIKNVNLLKELGIGFDYGFMLFQPDTDFNSLNQNLSFLKILCGDGYTPLTFLKLLPLYETRVEKELLKEGRLIINNGLGDYDFLEESMNDYYNFVMSCLRECLTKKNGFVNVAQCAISNLEIYFHFFDTSGESKIYHKCIHKIISEFNNYLLNTLKELINLFETGEYKSGTDLIEFYRMIIKITHDYYRDLILNTTIEFNVKSSSVRQPAGKKKVAGL
jgi:anaerobic magnesium-protoporphyrin IX monomethyl ester cyclase